MRGPAHWLLGVVVLVLTSGSPGYAGENEAPAPSFVVGDTWKYKNSYGKYTESVVELGESDRAVFARSYEPNARFLIDRDLTVRKIEGKPKRDATNYLNWQFIKFPAAPGLTFTYKIEFQKWTFALEVKAVAWEEIEVPAGKFRALRMESCWTNETTGWYGCDMKHWYAPDARAFIKRQTPSDWSKDVQKLDFELDSFTPGTR